jgi:hypothetical protein
MLPLEYRREPSQLVALLGTEGCGYDRDQVQVADTGAVVAAG